jgi:transposase
MARKRKSHTAGFKAQVALAAVKGDKTVSELASLPSVHPTLIHAWKKQLLDNAEELFQSGAKTTNGEHEALQTRLYEQIGRLQTELDWLKKKAASFGGA